MDTVMKNEAKDEADGQVVMPTADLDTLAAEIERLREAQNATNQLMSARGTNRDYWEATAHKLEAENARLREAASEYIRAMEGFASAVREDAGLAYPWPAQEITRAKLRAALEEKP